MSRPVVLLVTPEMAQQWRDQHQATKPEKKAPNPNRRPSHEARIEAFARDMKAGQWNYKRSTHPLSLRPGGRVWGWHRMNAVIRAGVPVVLKVVDCSGRLDGVESLT